VEQTATTRIQRPLSVLIRLLLLLGGIAVVWLIAPAAANADPSIGGVGDAVEDTTSGATDAVEDTASGATDAVENTTSGAADAVEDTTSGATDAVEDTTSGAADAAQAATSGATDTVETTASGAIDTVEGTTSDATQALKSAADEVVAAARSTTKQAIDVAGVVLETAGGLGDRIIADASALTTGSLAFVREAVDTVSDGVVPPGVDSLQDVAVATRTAPPPDLRRTSTDVSDRGARTASSITGSIGWMAAIPPGETAASPGSGPGPPVPSTDSTPATSSMSRFTLRVGPSSHDLAAVLAAFAIALALVRWSRRERERTLTPVFLSLVERPG
jgi:hypothetical protein